MHHQSRNKTMSDIFFSFSFAFAFQEVFFFAPTTGPFPDSWPPPIPKDRRGFPTTCFHQARFTTIPPTENPFPLFLARGGRDRSGKFFTTGYHRKKREGREKGGKRKKVGKITRSHFCSPFFFPFFWDEASVCSV